MAVFRCADLLHQFFKKESLLSNHVRWSKEEAETERSLFLYRSEIPASSCFKIEGMSLDSIDMKRRLQIVGV